MRQFKPGQLQSGSLYPITASFALTSSYTLGLDTGSLTTTASFNAFTASYTTGSFTGSFRGDGSQLTGIVSSKWTGSNPISRESDVEITGSLRVQGSITGSLFGTASWANNAITASFITTAQTASYVTASGVFGPYGSNSIISASYATNALNAQDILVYVLNNSGYNISKGTVVHITASGNSSDIPRIISASYENDANSANTLGIANESIANGANGYVMTEGVLKGIDTSAFISGQMIYLGASGSIIGSAPQAPLHAVRLGQVVRVQQNNGSVYVRIDNGYELDELHDVRIMTASLQYGDLLMRSGSVWTNTKQLSGSYGITGTLSATHVTASDLYAGATYISGSLIVNGQSTFYGTASFVNVTASNLFVSESFISVNVFEPVERFGGLKVYDSGSSTATASLAWDSLHNHWVYQNVDGATYTGGMLLAGPRNTGSLGDEPNLTKWFIPRGDGGDHLDNSQIFTSGSVTQITGSLTVTSGVTASLNGTASFSTSASQAISASFASTSSAALLNLATGDTRSYALTMVLSSSFAPPAFTSPLNPSPLAVRNELVFNGNTGVLQTTASVAITASTATTASHALESNTIIPLSGLGRSGLITFVSSTGSAAIVRAHQTFNVVIDNAPSATVNLTGSLIATSITSSLQGTASYAVTASHALNSTLPAGSAGWIQFKGNSGNFDASSDFVFNKTYLSLTNGRSVSATGDYSHAEGDTSKAKGDYSHAEGTATIAVGQFSHAEGDTNSTGTAAYSCSITLGIVELSASYGDLTGTYVDGTRFYYTDISTVGNSIYYSIVTGSFFNGTNTIFQLLNDTSTTINPAGILDKSGDILDIAGGLGAHVEGNANFALGDFSHAEGQGSATWGSFSHAEGTSITYGAYSHAEGTSITYGDYSHAEGTSTYAIANYSHAEGDNTYAGHQAWYANIAAGKIVFPSYYGDLTGIASPGAQLLVDDGNQQTVLIHEVASIIYSGSGETEITLVDSTYDPQAGMYVGLVGNSTLTYGDYNIGNSSHAAGSGTITLGYASNASGYATTAYGYYQTVVGQYNAPVLVSSSFVVGNGVSGTPSNLLVAYGNTVQVTGSIGIHNVVSATLTSLSSSFGTTPTTAYSIPVQPNGGAWFEYVIRSGSNARTGQIMAVWDDTLVNFTDTTTTDLGDTSGVTLAVTNDTSNITFDASATTDDWSIKAIIRSI